jgi:hypothetical protein
MCCRNVAAETDTSHMLTTPILFIYRFVSDIQGITFNSPTCQKKKKIQTFSPLWKSEVIQQIIPLHVYSIWFLLLFRLPFFGTYRMWSYALK